jgi:asparagine synthase (glutamine-hydrolysing)
MGAITAIVSKKSENVAKIAVTMLKMLKHKGTETFGLASPTIVNIEKSIDSLQDRDVSSPILIGHVFSRILSSDIPQPIRLDNKTLVFEGRVYPLTTESSHVKFAAEKLNQNRRNKEVLIKDFDGDFAFAVAEPEGLTAGRDSLGVYPFYYGENASLAAFASERKVLWRIGIREAHSFPPGHIAIFDKHGLKFKPVKTLVRPRVGATQATMQTAAKKTRKLLQRSVRQRVSGLKEVAVAFSGGLDSSMIAVLAKNLGVDVHLILVSLRSQPEIEHAKEASEALRLPLRIYTYSEKTVEECIPQVLWLIEEANPVKTSIGIPVFWTADKASRIGYDVIFAGQGADELFGGYKRYLNDYLRYGEEHVQKTSFNDAVRMYELNFERDRKICNFHNVELRLPFATRQLALFATSLPLHLKIEAQNGSLRKIVLRKVAEDMGLPHFILNKPKKAIQYATGVNKVIKKLAEEKGFSTKEYLENMLQVVFKGMM